MQTLGRCSLKAANLEPGGFGGQDTARLSKRIWKWHGERGKEGIGICDCDCDYLIARDCGLALPLCMDFVISDSDHIRWIDEKNGTCGEHPREYSNTTIFRGTD
jgi:hypothetical protein